MSRFLLHKKDKEEKKVSRIEADLRWQIVITSKSARQCISATPPAAMPSRYEKPIDTFEDDDEHSLYRGFVKHNVLSSRGSRIPL